MILDELETRALSLTCRSLIIRRSGVVSTVVAAAVAARCNCSDDAVRARKNLQQ